MERITFTGNVPQPPLKLRGGEGELWKHVLSAGVLTFHPLPTLSPQRERARVRGII
jgi:hypothetical protein